MCWLTQLAVKFSGLCSPPIFVGQHASLLDLPGYPTILCILGDIPRRYIEKPLRPSLLCWATHLVVRFLGDTALDKVCWVTHTPWLGSLRDTAGGSLLGDTVCGSLLGNSRW